MSIVQMYIIFFSKHSVNIAIELLDRKFVLLNPGRYINIIYSDIGKMKLEFGIHSHAHTLYEFYSNIIPSFRYYV